MQNILNYVKEHWLNWLFAGITAATGFAVKRLYSKFQRERDERILIEEQAKAEQKIIKEGILAILHDRLYQACRFHISQRKITVADLKNVEYLYDSYHDLGGNGTGTQLYNRVCGLPIEEELEEMK
ncbi:MAG: hypothetical protein ACK5LX_16865 [Oscillospiraceae bacterium]